MQTPEPESRHNLTKIHTRFRIIVFDSSNIKIMAIGDFAAMPINDVLVF